MFCAQCGTKVVSEGTFCHSCGSRLLKPPDASADVLRASLETSIASAGDVPKTPIAIRVAGVLAVLWGLSIWALAAFSDSSSKLGAVGTGALCLAYGATLLQRHRAARWLGPLLAGLFTVGTILSGLVPILILTNVGLFALVFYVHVKWNTLMSVPTLLVRKRRRVGVQFTAIVGSAAAGALLMLGMLRWGATSPSVRQPSGGSLVATDAGGAKPDYQQWLRDLRPASAGASQPTTTPLTDAQKVDRTANKQIAADVDSQAKCAAQAARLYADTHTTNNSLDGYVNHFNTALNRCFVAVQTTQLVNSGGFVTDRTVYDAFEGTKIATYDWNWGGPDSTKTAILECSVTLPSAVQKTCLSEDEFKALVKVYMDLP